MNATANYVAKVANLRPQDVIATLEKSFQEQFKDVKAGARAGVAAWSRKNGKAVGQLKEEPSSVGIAREYALLLAEIPTETIRQAKDKGPAEKLTTWIVDNLSLPPQTLPQTSILTGE